LERQAILQEYLMIAAITRRPQFYLPTVETHK
jgi:hypothetical protein